MLRHLSQRIFRTSSWIVGCVAISIAGCADSTNSPLVDRVSVAGMVTLNGQPLKAGAIVFHGPLDSADGATITSHAFIEDGRYTIDASDGPAIGTSRVEIRPQPRSREEYEALLDQAAKSRRRTTTSPTVVEIPKEYYGEQSELRVELVSGQHNQHDFKLDSKR